MIFNINEENIDSLAITACPDASWVIENCVFLDDKLHNGPYDCSCVAICRACWLKYLSKESEYNHE